MYKYSLYKRGKVSFSNFIIFGMETIKYILRIKDFFNELSTD